MDRDFQGYLFDPDEMIAGLNLAMDGAQSILEQGGV